MYFIVIIEGLNANRTQQFTMTKINLQYTLKKPFSNWTDEEKMFFLYDLLDHHHRPLPGYSETMLDNVIYTPADSFAFRVSKE
jgi:hypothetical protein